MILKSTDAALLIERTASTGAVLVGGQAVAFWVRYFGIASKLPVLTRDIDYLGTSAEARTAARLVGFPHRLKLATLDDATPNTAVLSVDMIGYPEPVIIDYLAAVLGLETKMVRSSAVKLEFAGSVLFVLHPILLLQAKFWNLHWLAHKRTAEGIEQARLAVEIVAAYLRQMIASKAVRRDLLRAVQSVARFAATAPARAVKESHGLDCLAAIPSEAFTEGVLPPLFRERHWPQLQAAAGESLPARRAAKRRKKSGSV